MKVTIKGRVLEITHKDEKKATDIVLFQAGERNNPLVRLADGKQVPKVGEEYSVEGELLTWSTRNGGIGSMVSVR